ncbi:tetraspanin-31 isoform X3 [Salvelinus sp. IW2-2015]|uniref:tetraspanin-31 isoform X3 n=1 Tax=Salvelinus sp. IW2-2015 TaxID=2691554 RepID=UPI0038D399BF
MSHHSLSFLLHLFQLLFSILCPITLCLSYCTLLSIYGRVVVPCLLPAPTEMAASRSRVKLLSGTWALMSNDTRLGVESKLNCCGLLNNNQSKEQFNEDVKLCNAPCKHARICFTCGDLMLQHAAEALKILGAVGLFFSFTECIFSRRKGTTPVKPITQLHKILGVWLAARYRNQKDPRANPSAFL